MVVFIKINDTPVLAHSYSKLGMTLQQILNKLPNSNNKFTKKTIKYSA